MDDPQSHWPPKLPREGKPARAVVSPQKERRPATAPCPSLLPKIDITSLHSRAAEREVKFAQHGMGRRAGFMLSPVSPGVPITKSRHFSPRDARSAPSAQYSPKSRKRPEVRIRSPSASTGNKENHISRAPTPDKAGCSISRSPIASDQKLSRGSDMSGSLASPSLLKTQTTSAGSRKFTRLAQGLSGITALNKGPKAMNQNTFTEMLNWQMTAEELFLMYTEDILSGVNGSETQLETYDTLSAISEASVSSSCTLTSDDEEEQQMVHRYLPLPTMEPQAARSAPFLFEHIHSLMEASNSLAALAGGTKLARDKSAVPTLFEKEKARMMEFGEPPITPRDNQGREEDKLRARRVEKIRKDARSPSKSNFSCHFPEELAWVYPASHPAVCPHGATIGSISTFKPVLPFTPLTANLPGTPVANNIATFKEQLDQRTGLETEWEESEDDSPRSKDSDITEAWAKATRKRAKLDEAQTKAWEEIENQMMTSAPSPEDVGPFYLWGEVGRLRRRFLLQNQPDTFNMSHTMFGESRMAALVEFLIREKRVKKLLLRNNALSDGDLKLLVDSLTKKGVSVTSLDLSENKLTMEAADVLIPVLKFTASSSLLCRRDPKSGKKSPHGLLSEIILAGNKISDQGVSVFCRNMLSKTCTIRILDLSRCHLGEIAACAIGELLEGTSCLVQLSLGWNRFGMRGARAIAEGMKCNSSVTHLSLTWAGLGDKGTSFIAYMLEANHTLKVLDVSGNSVSANTCVVLREMLRTNQGLDELGLRDNPLGMYGARKLLRSVTAGYCKHIDLRGCSFLKNYDDCENDFDPKHPNGHYRLNLGSPADYLIARQLLELAHEQNPQTWKHVTLNGRSVKLKHLLKNNWSIPTYGNLNLDFVSAKRPLLEDLPLTDEEFNSVWVRLASDEILDAHDKSMTDNWKLGLLQVLCLDCYFTSEKARRIVESIGYGDDKVEAAVLVFGRVVDPENFSLVSAGMRPAQEDLTNARLGILSMFHPENPTGAYDLILGQQAHYTIAKRLLELFCKQYDDNHCDLPLATCLPQCCLDGNMIFVKDPRAMELPREGRLIVTFADLRPLPFTAAPLSRQHFLVLMSNLLNCDKLDGHQLMKTMKDLNVEKSMDVLSRFDKWKGDTVMMPKDTRKIKDLDGVVAALRTVAIHNYVMSWQIRVILLAIPHERTMERVEVATMLWGRTLDRKEQWADTVIRTLKPQEQIVLCQRLGYFNVFDSKRPEMRYQLRMYHPDEYQVAHKLYRMVSIAKHTCMTNFYIDGEERRVNQSANLWSVMRGNAAEGNKPKVTLEFDFVWPDEARMNWAATLMQSAFKAFKVRKSVKELRKTGVVAMLTARVVRNFKKKVRERQDTS